MTLRITLHDSVYMAPEGTGSTLALSGGEEQTQPLPSPAANDQGPRIAILADGGHVLVWQDRQGYDCRTKWQRFDADGNALGTVQSLATADGGNSSSPSVTAMADGGFAIAYGASQSTIEVQRFDSASAAVGEPVLTNAAGNYDTAPTITGLPDGGFLMTWVGQHLGTQQWDDSVGIRRFDASGQPVGAIQRVNVEEYGNQSSPSVAVLADGGWVVTWQTQSASNWSYDVAMRRFDASGQPMGGEVLVSPGANQELVPAVTALADGGWVVAFASSRSDSSDVYLQVYNADGTVRGSEISLAAAGYQFSPAVAALEDGGFMVAWRSSTPTGDADILAQRFTADGSAMGEAFTVNETLTGDQDAPILAGRPDGGLVIAWQTSGSFTTDPSNPWSAGVMAGGTVSQRIYTTFDPLAVSEDATASIAFATLAPGQATYAVLSQPVAGLVVDNGDGTFSFDPAGQYDHLAQGQTQSVTFAYRTTDAYGAATDRIATLHVIGTNDGPVAGPVSGAVEQGTPGNFAFVGSDVDDDAVLTYQIITPPAVGTVVLHDDGTFSFDPGPAASGGATGTVTFTYRVTDQWGASSDATVTLDITEPPPSTGGALVGGNEQTEELSSPTTANDFAPSIAVLADGGHVLVWMETQSNPYLVKWQRFDAHGNAISPAQDLITAENGAVSTSVTAMADGGFAIAYRTWSTAFEVQRFDASSLPVGAPIQTNGPQYYDSTPVITALPDGGFLITWEGTDLGASRWDPNIGILRFDTSGQPVGDIQRVNVDESGRQAAPAVSVLADGGWVVAWHTEAADSSGFDVVMRRFDASGQPVGDESLVGQGTSLYSPVTIAALADGGWVLSYGAYRDGQDNVCARIYGSDGTPCSGEVRIPAPYGETSPTVTALQDGGFMMAWSGGSLGGDTEVWAQRFAADGTAIGDYFVVNQTTSGSQDAVTLSARPDGGFVIAWQTTGTSAYDPNHTWPPAPQVGGTVSQRVFEGHATSAAVGGQGNDLLLGSAGNDTLSGGDGSDTYLAGSGLGADTIVNTGHGSDGDRVQFGHAIDREQLWFQQVGADLKVAVIGTEDSVCIKDWFASSQNQVESFATGYDSVLDAAQVQNLVTAMAAFSPPPMGQTHLSSEQAEQLQPVIAANWH